MVKKMLTASVLVLALFLMTIAAGCGTNGEEPAEDNEPVKLKIAHCTWVGYAPLYIAQEKGFFLENGVDPELVLIEDEGQYAAAVISNEIQGLGQVMDREVISYANGVPVQIVAAMCESLGGDGIVAKKEIKSMADLKGATIGLDKASTSYFFFLTALRDSGITEDDINIQEMGSGDAGAAFVAGRLDAAVTWEPWLTKASDREGGHVLVSSNDYPKTIVDVITLHEDFVETYPKAAEGIVKAWYQAIEFWQDNPEEANQIMAKGLDLPLEELEEMLEGVAFFGENENKDFFADKDNPESIYGKLEVAVDFWKEKGIIKTEIDLNKFINDTFVKKAEL